MVDMKSDQTIVIWEDCDPTVLEAIKRFEDRWRPYSASSRRYPIVRLIQELIDPAVAAYTATLPQRYLGHIPGAGTGVSLSGIIRLVGLDAMVRMQRQLLRQFIKTEDRQTSRDQRFTATLETLIGLVWDCACKRPKTSASAKGVSLNAQRKHGFCDFCGNPTEFSAFMANVAEQQVNDAELENRKKLELSHQYCKGHRPKLTNGEWNPAYRQAKRSLAQFELELARLSQQCAKPATPQVKSGDQLVDGYFFHYVMRQTLQPADKAELRNQARLMVDSKLSDRKKQILILQWSGLNQSEIARRLGIERQAVSKALTSIPAMFQLKKKRPTR
jgi:DNA-binding CsgD family transcriptional regulator